MKKNCRNNNKTEKWFLFDDFDILWNYVQKCKAQIPSLYNSKVQIDNRGNCRGECQMPNPTIRFLDLTITCVWKSDWEEGMGTRAWQFGI